MRSRHDCTDATICQPCGTPPELDANCADSGVDCARGEVRDPAGFCRRHPEFFPRITLEDDCPATLDEAKALTCSRCSESSTPPEDWQPKPIP